MANFHVLSIFFQMKHSGQNIYECKYCEQMFPSKIKRIEHMSDAHGLKHVRFFLNRFLSLSSTFNEKSLFEFFVGKIQFMRNIFYLLNIFTY